MKKRLLAVVVLFLVFGLVGCGTPKQPATSDSSTNTSGDTSRQIVEVDAKKVEDLIQTDSNLGIIDVSGKWADGHIVGALDIPLDKLQGVITDNSLNASTHYVVYAHDEETSKKAAAMLLAGSYTDVYRLVGGYAAWVASGGYTEK
ncbi:MAG: rhodanese-like domain-containing protein [Candidatus Cryosericum sp.]